MKAKRILLCWLLLFACACGVWGCRHASDRDREALEYGQALASLGPRVGQSESGRSPVLPGQPLDALASTGAIPGAGKTSPLDRDLSASLKSTPSPYHVTRVDGAAPTGPSLPTPHGTTIVPAPAVLGQAGPALPTAPPLAGQADATGVPPPSLAVPQVDRTSLPEPTALPALPSAPGTLAAERPEFVPEVPNRPPTPTVVPAVIGTTSALAKLSVANPRDTLPPAPQAEKPPVLPPAPATELNGLAVPVTLPPAQIALNHSPVPPGVPGATSSPTDNLPPPTPPSTQMPPSSFPATRPDGPPPTGPGTLPKTVDKAAETLPVIVLPRSPAGGKIVAEPPAVVVLRNPDAPPATIAQKLVPVPVTPPQGTAPSQAPAASGTPGTALPETAEPPGRLVPLAPAKGLQPVSSAQPGAPAGSLQNLHRLAQESYGSIDAYLVRFRRREQVGARMGPEEVMLLKYRKQPVSIYFKWLSNEGKGREVVYVKGRYGNQIHTRIAAGDVPFMPAGKRMSISPDSMLVRSKSRHPITEAGIGSVIAHLGDLVEMAEHADPRIGGAKYLGLVRRKEFAEPVEAVLHVIPAGVEQGLPRGGRRFLYFDTKLRFPVLVITLDENQQEVEYYCYDRFLFPGNLSDDDFNPDLLWRSR